MNTADQILVIILSATLAIFLVLAIAAIIMIITLIKRLQTIASKAEDIVDVVSEVSLSLRKTVGSFTLLGAARSAFDAFSHFKNHKKKD